MMVENIFMPEINYNTLTKRNKKKAKMQLRRSEHGDTHLSLFLKKSLRQTLQLDQTDLMFMCSRKTFILPVSLCLNPRHAREWVNKLADFFFKVFMRLVGKKKTYLQSKTVYCFLKKALKKFFFFFLPTINVKTR